MLVGKNWNVASDHIDYAVAHDKQRSPLDEGQHRADFNCNYGYCKTKLCYFVHMTLLKYYKK